MGWVGDRKVGGWWVGRWVGGWRVGIPLVELENTELLCHVSLMIFHIQSSNVSRIDQVDLEHFRTRLFHFCPMFRVRVYQKSCFAERIGILRDLI